MFRRSDGKSPLPEVHRIQLPRDSPNHPGDSGGRVIIVFKHADMSGRLIWGGVARLPWCFIQIQLTSEGVSHQ